LLLHPTKCFYDAFDLDTYLIYVPSTVASFKFTFREEITKVAGF